MSPVSAIRRRRPVLAGAGVSAAPPLASVAIAAGVLAATALAVAAGGSRLVLVPAGALVVAPLLLRPRLAVALALTAAILAEGRDFGLFPFTAHLYEQVFKGLTPLDGLVILALAAVALDAARRGRPLRVPATLALPLVLLFLAMLSGALTAHGAGVGARQVLLSERLFAYVLLVPLAVVNLDLDERETELALRGAFVLAVVKAALGLVAVVAGRGLAIYSSGHLTYYEPAANWLIMIACLALLALVVMRRPPPLWVALPAAIMLASLVLSYRRSFWIATILAALLVILLGLSPAGRRLLVPVGLLAAGAIWLLGSVHFQAQTPLVERARSLQPARVSANAEDRYRFDERANVLEEIRRRPISGLGLTGEWRAIARPLGVEHEGGRRYVHFAALFFWLDLGILGLGAYIALLATAAALGWRVWRTATQPASRALGLASLCGLVGLAVMETSASWTGVDVRFSLLFAAQIGFLASIAAPRPGRA